MRLTEREEGLLVDIGALYWVEEVANDEGY
jgi:hypothetical protein